MHGNLQKPENQTQVTCTTDTRYQPRFYIQQKDACVYVIYAAAV
jgi:hypothetical protein